METEALVDASGDSLAEMEAESLSNPFVEVNPEAQLDALADTLSKVEAGILSDALPEAKAELLIDAEPNILPEVEAETDRRSVQSESLCSG